MAFRGARTPRITPLVGDPAAGLPEPSDVTLRPPAPGEAAPAPEQLLTLARTLAVALASFAIVGHLVNHLLLDDAIPDLNAQLELSFNNWFTVVATFAGALAAALHAHFVPVRRNWYWTLATVLAFLSVDDMLRVHERIGDRIGIEHVELLIFGPLYGLVLLIVLTLARESSRAIASYLRAGSALLVTAVAIDLLSPFTRELAEEGTSWPHAIRMALEEGSEVAGWTALSAALVVLLCAGLVAAGGESSRRPPGGAGRQGPLGASVPSGPARASRRTLPGARRSL